MYFLSFFIKNRFFRKFCAQIYTFMKKVFFRIFCDIFSMKVPIPTGTLFLSFSTFFFEKRVYNWWRSFLFWFFKTKNSIWPPVWDARGPKVHFWKHDFWITSREKKVHFFQKPYRPLRFNYPFWNRQPLLSEILMKFKILQNDLETLKK